MRWEALGARALEVYAPKTRRRRSVRLLAPLAADLAELRRLLGRPGPRELVFPRADGGPMDEGARRNWRRRVFRPAAEAAGLPDARPYDLRHSFVSLLIQEGQSVVEVARQAGHSPSVCANTYAHVFEELDPAERVPAEAVIRAARETGVRVVYAGAGERGA